MVSSVSFAGIVKVTLSKLYPPEEGWEIEENPSYVPVPPTFLVRRKRHVVVVDVRSGGQIKMQDVLRIDEIRDSVLGIMAVIYAPTQIHVPEDVQRHAQRLGVRILKLPVS